MKYSIIIPAYNNLQYTFQCIQSVFKHTRDYELILVNNGSSDETIHYFNSLKKSYPFIKIIDFKTNTGFAHACNSGFDISEGDHIVFLNNDAIVTPSWVENMLEAIPACEKEFDVSPIGFVGPRSNNAGGNQAIQTDPYNLDQLDPASIEHHQQYKGQTLLAGFLSGFCLVCKRQALEDVGLFDERFKIGGVEDTELCLRAQLKGWKLAIDNSTYVHHYGQQTIKTMIPKYEFTHRGNQLAFIEKYYSDTPKKLIATFRVHNQPDFLKKSLARASEFSDEIIVLLHNCTDNTEEIALSFPKVKEIIPVNAEWDLYRDRCLLMDSAKKHQADWIIAIDADEIPEDSFTYDYVHSLMNPIRPDILAYGINFRNFFLGTTHFRIDGTFGDMWGVRFWRVLPNSHPRLVRGNRRCCLHCPAIPPFNTVHLRTRWKHYGYISPEVCERKFNFYTNLDPNPDRGYISPDGYDHLISPNIAVSQYVEKNDLSLNMMVKNEEINLFNFLFKYHLYFDEIIIIDTGSVDRTVKIAEMFGSKVFHLKFRGDFSEVRNFAKSKSSCSWIFSADPDEDIFIPDFFTLFKMLDDPLDAFLFQFSNFMPDGTVCYSDNVRLFRNIPEIYWSYRCHETVSNSIVRNNLKIAPCPFKIKHYGFLKGEDSKHRKMSQYGRMLRKQIKEYPGDPLGYFHYAFHLFEEHDEHKGEKYLKKSLDLRPDFFLSSKELGLRRLIQAHDYLSQTSHNIPPGHYFNNFITHLANEISNLLKLNPDNF